MAALQGRRVFVAEDEYMIAQEVSGMLSEFGAEVLGPVPAIADALHLIASEDRIDAALLDVNLRGSAVWPVVDALLLRKVSVVLATGYNADAIPQAYAHLFRCDKPIIGRDLTRMLEQVMVA